MSKPPLRVVFAPEANRDLIERADFLTAEGGFDLSDRFVNAVTQTIELLTKMPGMGRGFRFGIDRKAELRRVPVSGAFHRTVVFYTVTAAELRVERVLHSAQDLPRFFR